jgi:hypothetical protein
MLYQAVSLHGRELACESGEAHETLPPEKKKVRVYEIAHKKFVESLRCIRSDVNSPIRLGYEVRIPQRAFIQHRFGEILAF